MEGKVPVFYDCDPGHDDAMAILLATQHPRINLIGISTIAGNQTVDKTCENALKMLQILKCGHIPVVKGSAVPLLREGKICPEIHGNTGLDGHEFPKLELQERKDNAIVFMYNCIKGHFLKTKEKVNLVATGSLTNVALLLSVFPDVTSFLLKICIMGGAIGLGNTGPKAEFNIETDPEAAAIVFKQRSIPVVMVPVEVTHTVLVTEEIFCEIDSLRSEFSKLIVGLLSFFKETYIKVFNFPAPPLHDPCAMMYCVHPEIFKSKRYNVTIERKSEFCDGATVVDIHGVSKREKNAIVCEEIDVKKFWEIMLLAIRRADSITPMNSKDPNVTAHKRKREDHVHDEENPMKKQKLD